MRKVLRLASLVPLLLLAGCGFHLRGVDDTSSFPFATLHVTTPAGGLGDVVQRQLALQPSIKLVGEDQADAVLTIEKEKLEKQILTVNNAGHVGEYLLILHARFKLELGKREWIPPTHMVLRRDYSFNPNNPLGTDAEEVLLLNDMRLDASQQILHRLSAAKHAQLTVENYAPPEAETNESP